MLAGTRDVAIILLAVESIVIGVLLTVLLIQIRKLIRMLQEEIKPMLESANDTVKNVKGTTQFVSETVVTPLIKIKSYYAGTMQALHTLFAIGRKVGPVRSEPVVDEEIEIDVPDNGQVNKRTSALKDEEVL